MAKTLRQSAGMAHVAFTVADELAGFPNTKAELACVDTSALQREYLNAMRDGFNKMFGHNARKFGNLVVAELLSRGETAIPNIFGPIEIRPFTY